jgi:putative hydrolase of the HAD superfamily
VGVRATGLHTAGGPRIVARATAICPRQALSSRPWAVAGATVGASNDWRTAARWHVTGTTRGQVTVVGLDGDDTLWHNESIFAATHERYRALIQRYVPDADIDDRLLDVERRNITVFGYGVKGFALSLIETAIAVTDGRLDSADIALIIGWAKQMLRHPVELLEGVADTVEALAQRYRLALITKGDFFHQESKVARSGLADHFDVVEIVAEKDPLTYRRVLDRAGIDPASFMMVGNSLRSDVLPVLDVGGRAVHIPYHVTWQHEHIAEHEHDGAAYARLADIRELPGLLDGGA